MKPRHACLGACPLRMVEQGMIFAAISEADGGMVRFLEAPEMGTQVMGEGGGREGLHIGVRGGLDRGSAIS